MSIEDKRADSAAPIERRDFLRLGTAAAVAASMFAPAEAFALPNPRAVPRQLAFFNLHTGEHLSAEYWAKGRYRPAALHAVNHLFRDHRTGAMHRIDPRLLDLVYALKRKVGAHGPFHIVSGYRSPESNALLIENDHYGVAQHSYHIKGMAVDLRLPGYSLSRLHQAALSLRGGGVGYYPESDFIHVDVGPLRRW